MKFFKILVAFSLMFFGYEAMAQNVKVTAVLLDDANSEPLGFATVSLTREGQTKPTKYILSSDKGVVLLENVKSGKYTVKAELLGYLPFTKEIEVKREDIDLGKVKLKVDTEMLDAASVSALGNPVIIKKDTVEYNADSFRTTENDVLEDLLKKLPGVEVSDEGTITFNGESVSKITIDNKTFFLDDPQLASKNIPAKLVKKLKVIKKKSEQAEFTGIDDGEEETVIDLSVQPGMMKGLMGNVQGAGGMDVPSQAGISADPRYQGNAFIGRFTEGSQISLILNANNTNSRASGRGMRGGGFGGGGITTAYMAGINGAWDLFDDRMNVGGNYTFNKGDRISEQQSLRKTYLEDYNLINNTSSVNLSDNINHSFGMRLEHEFSENTSILFEPSINFGTSGSVSTSRDTTYHNDFDGATRKLNDAYTDNSSTGDNVSARSMFLFRQRLGIPGRTLTAMVNLNVSVNNSEGINKNGTNVYDDLGVNIVDVKLVDQNYTNKNNSYSLNGRVTYTEPMGDNFYLEGNYSYNWNKSVSEKVTFDRTTGLQDYNFSNNIVNENHRQDIGFNALYQSAKLRAQVGFSAMPTKTHNSTTKYNATTQEFVPQVYDDFRWNFSPTAMITGDLSENTNVRLFYRGNSSQPSTSQLMPVPDNTDPLNVNFGNPGLTPYFNHSIRGHFRYSNRQTFSSFNMNFNAGMTQNPIVSATWFGSNGGRYSMPFNGPATANAGTSFFFNLPIGKSAFSVNNNTSVNWNKSATYVGTNIDMSTYEEKGYYEFMEEFIEKFNDPTFYKQHITENVTQTVNVSERLRLTYRGEFFEATLGGRTNMNKSWYSISTNKDQTTTWNNQLSAGFVWNWVSTGISAESDFDYNWYAGYETKQPSTAVLNAEISKMVLNNTMTISLRAYDILGQTKNLTVTDSGNFHTESISNTLGRYVVVGLTWRFGTMGGRGNRAPMGGGPGGGGRPMRGGPGGPGGPR